MEDALYSRTSPLLGEEAVLRLRSATVAVFGLGGVGSYIAEALARGGVGHLILLDGDSVSDSNRNRQLFATSSTVGMRKTEAAAARLRDINPKIGLTLYDMFYCADTADRVDLHGVTYAADAIDSVRSKLELILRCRAAGVPLICSMGTGNKLDPTRFRISDIYKTSVCPLAREMRRLCRKEGVESLKVLWSDEEPILPPPGAVPAGEEDYTPGITKKAPPGSVSFVPSVAGLIIAGEIIRHIASGPQG